MVQESIFLKSLKEKWAIGRNKIFTSYKMFDGSKFKVMHKYNIF